MQNPEGKKPVAVTSDLELRWSGTSDTGRFRKTNQDAFLALTFNAKEVIRLGKTGQASLKGGDFVFAVSDGMGGHKAGEFASRIAVDKITELFPRAFQLDAIGFRRGSGDLLQELFTAIHREIVHLGQAYEECSGMGATLSLCWFRPEWMHFCHIGDSRIYYLPKDGGIKQVTEDHSHVGWLVRTGKITPMQARFHPARNQLNQALTAGNGKIDPQHGAIGYELGDRFIICSDGLNEGMSDSNLDHLSRNLPERLQDLEIAEALVQESVKESGKDNTTAVVIEVVGEDSD